LWDDYGVRSDILPFTHGFPRADIHELLTVDLLHQLIKGKFKDHLVTWVNEYLQLEHGEKRAHKILIELQAKVFKISAIPEFPGLRRFPDGRNFSQWTGDDSKSLRKVCLSIFTWDDIDLEFLILIYLPAVAGYLPSHMVKCLAAFLDFCYTVRRNSITTEDFLKLKDLLGRFHQYRKVFINCGVRADISLPRQHSLLHHIPSIILFGCPNGLCSSITESKHIRAVKEPCRRSSR
ncbi:hypothetical protein B0H14DRAFT_2246172, partial [Mycena olivaceomarginata]